MSVNQGNDGYRLERDIISSVRLNAQHYLWKQATGFNFHPVLPSLEGANFKVADIGTGTGIWVLDASREDPKITIEGFDKCLDQCPPEELWPTNVSFGKLNFLQEIPSELKSTYDIVHARLIQGGLQETPSPALKTFFAMLKPGGHLQWEEINLNAVKVSAVRPDSERSAMDKLAEEIQHWEFGKWTPDLAKICTENGFVNTRTDKYPVPNDIVIPFVETQLMAYEEVSRIAMDNDKSDSKGPWFRDLIKKAKAELDKGVWLDHSLEITIATKPS